MTSFDEQCSWDSLNLWTDVFLCSPPCSPLYQRRMRMDHDDSTPSPTDSIIDSFWSLDQAQTIVKEKVDNCNVVSCEMLQTTDPTIDILGECDLLAENSMGVEMYDHGVDMAYQDTNEQFDKNLTTCDDFMTTPAVSDETINNVMREVLKVFPSVGSDLDDEAERSDFGVDSTSELIYGRQHGVAQLKVSTGTNASLRQQENRDATASYLSKLRSRRFNGDDDNPTSAVVVKLAPRGSQERETSLLSRKRKTRYDISIERSPERSTDDDDDTICYKPRPYRSSGRSSSNKSESIDTNKNAVQARINRQKKKAYVSGLEKKVASLQDENNRVRNECRLVTVEADSLRDEVQYLKAVLANQSVLASLLKNIGCNAAMSNDVITESSPPARSRTNNNVEDHDYGQDKKRRKSSGESNNVMAKVGGGICLHVDQGHISFELCRHCAQKASSDRS